MRFQLLTLLATCLAISTFAEPKLTVLWRTPLNEAGQSGIAVHSGKVYLTIHAPLGDKLLKGGVMKSADVKAFNSMR